MSDVTMTGELLVRRANRKVAQLQFVERDDAFVLDLVLVVSAERGGGLGTELVRRLLTLADAAGKPVVTTARPIGANSPEILARLVRYYERLGFASVERLVTSVKMRREPPPARPAALAAG